MEKKQSSKLFPIICLISLWLFFIASLFFPINNIDSVSYFYKCTYCQKVKVNYEEGSPLNCLNNKNVSNVNIAYNIDDPKYLNSGEIPVDNKVYMFINYKNRLAETERISVSMPIYSDNFLWDFNTVAKIIFEGKDISLVTSKDSLMMNKEYYLNIINQLASLSCEKIKLSENNIDLAEKKYNNLKSWEKEK